MADEIRRHGVTLALISPGSRSAALAIAFEELDGVETRIVLDERSAAFQAVGHARVSGTPAVCVSTSGTAVANYLPGIVEADEDLVPLIAMTADRPPELRQIGANQTIDQVGIFGNRVRWFVDVGVADVVADGNRYWRTTISQAVARSLGHGGRPGPVHINIAFREPSVPVPDDGRASSPLYEHSIEGRADGSPWQAHRNSPRGVADLSDVVSGRGLVIAGSGIDQPEGLLEESTRLGWPVLATAQSSLRGGEALTSYHHVLVDDVPPGLEPDLVITVGRIGPSDRLSALTAQPCHQVHLDRWGRWNDPWRHSTFMAAADPVLTLGAVDQVPIEGWSEAWAQADDVVRRALDDRLDAADATTGPGVARALSRVGWQTLAVGSSMPIRDVDAHTVAPGRVIANRGASGIDGFVSTALGAAIDNPGTLGLCGDLTFLHDSAGLVVDQRPDVVLVVIDNGGGGLFDLLPQATHAPGFEKLFIAPHHVDIEAFARTHGYEAGVVDNLRALSGELERRLAAGGAHILVVPVDRESDLKTRRGLDEAAQMALASSR